MDSGSESRIVSMSGGRGWSGKISAGGLGPVSCSERVDGSIVIISKFWSWFWFGIVACRSAMRSTRVLLDSLVFGSSRGGRARGIDGELELELERAARRCFLFLGDSMVCWRRRMGWNELS